MGMSVVSSSPRQNEGSASSSKPIDICESWRDDTEPWDILDEAALNFVIDGERMSGTETEASAPAVTNSDKLPEWLDTSVDEEAGQRESGNIRVNMD